MYKKIKKQIKGAFPWFMIINLIISTVVAGFVFNFDFKISSTLTNDLKFSMNERMAYADVASTTVTVKNAPPSFSVDAAESPASTSTSPVNVGASQTFTATGDDPENANYYFIVCSSNAVTPHNGAAPTCGATTFCTSGSTADQAQAQCTYSNVADPSSETLDWYAFVCDGHANDAACSPVNSGSQPGTLATSSPMYINHAPVFTELGTIDNFKDPGGTFTMEATTTDPDVARGAELLHLYVCQSNSWATSTGCAIPLCHGTSTSPNVSCSFATTTPAVDGNYTYYGFVMDDFSMPAAANSRNSTYTVNNVAPVVTLVIANNSNNIQLNIKNTATSSVATSSSVSVTDNNGCTDIRYASSSIYWSGVANAQNCTANNNNCYQMATTSCLRTTGTCTGPNDATATYVCTTTMAYHAIPTDNSTGNTNAATNWLAGITAFDEALNGTGTSTVGVEVLTSTALEVSETEIAYGTVRAGLNTGTSTATTTIVNYGNSPLNTYLYGTTMTSGPNTIDIHWQKHDLTAYFDYSGAGTFSTSTPPGDLEDTVINRPTSAADVTDNIYWGIAIPLGTLSGDYTGMNTFTAALDGNGVGW